MHVDGGVTSEVFFHGFMLHLEAAMREAGATAKPKARIYVVRNSQIRAQHEQVSAPSYKLVTNGWADPCDSSNRQGPTRVRTGSYMSKGDSNERNENSPGVAAVDRGRAGHGDTGLRAIESTHRLEHRHAAVAGLR